MSAFDPDADDPPADTGPATPAVVTSAALRAAVEDAVSARLRTEATALAGDAFEELMTPELHRALQDQARTTMATQLEAELAEVDPAATEPLFPTVQAWVHSFLAPAIVRRSSSDFVWCPRWWAHTEVVSRLTGLWITWEQARLGTPADVNTWWLQQLDPHLAVITAQGGPLDGCTSHDGHAGGKPGLRVEDPPPGTFGPP